MRYFDKYRKFLFVVLCLAFVFSVCGEPIEAGIHFDGNSVDSDCCFVCHPFHSGVDFEPVCSPNFTIFVFSNLYSPDEASVSEAPVFTLFHPPQQTV